MEGPSSISDKLIDEMKNFFGRDTKRIQHALTVLDFAEKIQATEGGDALVVSASAILHDIGIHEAECKYGSSADKYQEIEGPPIAEQILERNSIPTETIEHICRIVANHHSAKDIDTVEFRIIWDADNLVNLSEELKDVGKKQIQQIIDKVFKTNTGRMIAQKRLLEPDTTKSGSTETLKA